MKYWLLGALTASAITLSAQNVKPQVNVTVSEGTSMSVSVSPDGKTLACLDRFGVTGRRFADQQVHPTDSRPHCEPQA